MKKVSLLLVVAAIAAFAQAHSVLLTWVDTANPAGTTYNVYRGTGACSVSTSFAKIGSSVVPKTYTDLAVVSGTNYCYQVTAMNVNGESGPSNQITSGAIPALFPPTGVTVFVN